MTIAQKVPDQYNRQVVTGIVRDLEGQVDALKNVIADIVTELSFPKGLPQDLQQGASPKFKGLTVTTLNGNTWTAGTGVLTIAAGKTLTASNTLTLTATDGSTLAIGTGGTLGTAAYTATTAYATAAQGTKADTALQTTPASGGIVQSFVLYVRNNAGTMEHQIVTDTWSWTASNFVSKINAATNSYNTTPTGADASTAMAFGGKIGSANTNYFYLDVAAQTLADMVFICAIGINNTGTALLATPQRQSIDINGVTQIRHRISFTNATTAAAFALTTANMSAGQVVAVQCLGVLA